MTNYPTMGVVGDKISPKGAWHGPRMNFKILGPSLNFEMVNYKLLISEEIEMKI